MKKIIKIGNSKIIRRGYIYPQNNVEILEVLEKEQQLRCAYTEENLTPGYGRDVEHFNPILKGTVSDGYNNWFCACTRFNRKKGSTPRWLIHQPILHPTSFDLESRLLYQDGYYILAKRNDVEANNLRKYLFLNKYGLPKSRKSYIDRLKFMFGTDITGMKNYFNKFPDDYKYTRAIETEFGKLI